MNQETDVAIQFGVKELKVGGKGVYLTAALLGSMLFLIAGKVSKGRVGKIARGEQSIKKLYKSFGSEGISCLEDNVSAAEIKGIKKELAAYGINFSIRKVNDDSYSSKQRI